MELMERVQRFKRNFDAPEDPNVPWYRRKRSVIVLGIGVLVILGVTVLFFGGYFAGLSANKEHNDNFVPEPESRVALPPVNWDGVCPKKVDKCPSSFQGLQAPVILVSLDGFHPSLMDKGFTPTIKNIARCGTHSPYMFPVFPTKTFPNHFSQVTGVYPPHHGIVDNTMYDPIKKKLFKVGQPESLVPSWWLKEPIWVTSEKEGKRTACFYWPGSEVEINGTRPTFYKKYNSKVAFNSRVDQVLQWLDLPPTSRPHFLTLYVNEPDNSLHNFGINSKQTNDALAKVDRMIERLFSGLQQRNLVNCVNVIIMSDHGMSDVDCKRVVDIQNFINVSDTFNTVGPFGRIRPRGRRNSTAVDELVSSLKCKSPHMRAYHKEQLPIRLHYADNPRIEPIFLDLDAGWTVISKSNSKSDDSICSGGAHGYDNMFPDMRAIFLAHGPSFKKNFTMRPFLNVEVYELLAELVGVSPKPNNGTKGSMHYIMTSPKTLPSQTEPDPPASEDVPSDETVYDERLSASTCYCPMSGKQTKVNNLAVIRDSHLPFGIPYGAQDSSSLFLLYNEDYVSAFNTKYKMTLWSSFTLKERQYSRIDENICWNGDVRIPVDSSSKCADYRKATENDQYILQRPLYNPGFSEPTIREQAMLITNSIAKSFNHSNMIENPFNEMQSRWISQTGEMNVVTGPAFDIFATGVKPNDWKLMEYFEKNGPVPISTHIFVVMTWCSMKTDSLNNCEPSKLQAQGYLLPNKPYTINCEAAADMITKNVARVIDIETLTGFSFYTRLPIYDAIRLRTMMPERPF